MTDKPAAPAPDADAIMALADEYAKTPQQMTYTPTGYAPKEARAALRAAVERLQAAHDHQYAMAGLMLREAERNGRERDEAIALLREAIPYINYWEHLPAKRLLARIDALTKK